MANLPLNEQYDSVIKALLSRPFSSNGAGSASPYAGYVKNVPEQEIQKRSAYYNLGRTLSKGGQLPVMQQFIGVQGNNRTPVDIPSNYSGFASPSSFPVGENTLSWGTPQSPVIKNFPSEVPGQYVEDTSSPDTLVKSNRGYDPVRDRTMLGNRIGSMYQIDHIVPLALGGADTNENRQLLTNSQHQIKTKAQSVAYTLFAHGDISQKEAIALSANWKGKDVSNVPYQNEYGILQDKDGKSGIELARETLKKWNEPKPVGFKDVMAAMPEAMKNYGEGFLPDPVREFVKGIASGVTMGFVPYEQDDNESTAAKISGKIGIVVGTLVPFIFAYGGVAGAASLATRGSLALKAGTALKASAGKSLVANGIIKAASSLPAVSKFTTLNIVPSAAAGFLKGELAKRMALMGASTAIVGQGSQFVANKFNPGVLSGEQFAKDQESVMANIAKDFAYGAVTGVPGPTLKGTATAASLALGMSYMANPDDPAGALEDAVIFAALHAYGSRKSPTYNDVKLFGGKTPKQPVNPLLKTYEEAMDSASYQSLRFYAPHLLPEITPGATIPKAYRSSAKITEIRNTAIQNIAARFTTGKGLTPKERSQVMSDFIKYSKGIESGIKATVPKGDTLKRVSNLVTRRSEPTTGQKKAAFITEELGKGFTERGKISDTSAKILKESTPELQAALAEIKRITVAARQLYKGGLGKELRNQADIDDLLSFTKQNMDGRFTAAEQSATPKNLPEVVKRMATEEPPKDLPSRQAQLVDSVKGTPIDTTKLPQGDAALTGIGLDKNVEIARDFIQGVGGMNPDYAYSKNIILVLNKNAAPVWRMKYAGQRMTPGENQTVDLFPDHTLQAFGVRTNKATGETEILPLGSVASDYRTNISTTEGHTAFNQQPWVVGPKLVGDAGLKRISLHKDPIAVAMEKNNVDYLVTSMDVGRSAAFTQNSQKPFIVVNINEGHWAESIPFNKKLQSSGVIDHDMAVDKVNRAKDPLQKEKAIKEMQDSQELPADNYIPNPKPNRFSTSNFEVKSIATKTFVGELSKILSSGSQEAIAAGFNKKFGMNLTPEQAADLSFRKGNITVREAIDYFFDLSNRNGVNAETYVALQNIKTYLESGALKYVPKYGEAILDLKLIPKATQAVSDTPPPRGIDSAVSGGTMSTPETLPPTNQSPTNLPLNTIDSVKKQIIEKPSVVAQPETATPEAQPRAAVVAEAQPVVSPKVKLGEVFNKKPREIISTIVSNKAFPIRQSLPAKREAIIPENEPAIQRKAVKQELPPTGQNKGWVRRADKNSGYEVSSAGDKRFSAFYAKLRDGRSIEEAYQVGIKGYPTMKEGKGKPPKVKMDKAEQYRQYKALWEQWAKENPALIEELRIKSVGKFLTDKFANSDINQARALSEILSSSATGKKSVEALSPTKEKPQIVYGKTNRKRENGTDVNAQYDRTNNTITVDKEKILAAFKDKPWTKPKVKGVKPLPPKAFDTPQQWLRFNIEHERAHSRSPRGKDESMADYENRMNRDALQLLSYGKENSGVVKYKALSDTISKDTKIKNRILVDEYYQRGKEMIDNATEKGGGMRESGMRKDAIEYEAKINDEFFNFLRAQKLENRYSSLEDFLSGIEINTPKVTKPPVKSKAKPSTPYEFLPGKSDTPTKTYAGVGSRETPPAVLEEMKALGRELEKRGFTLNTGDAKGADSAFRESTTKKNVFTVKDATDKTREIAKEIHPRRSKLSQYALDLHARNVNQVFGRDLKTPVDFVVAWTKDGRDSGGTGQAIRYAEGKGIPVVNLYYSNWRQQLAKILDGPTQGNEFSRGSRSELVSKWYDHLAEKGLFQDPAMEFISRMVRSVKKMSADVGSKNVNITIKNKADERLMNDIAMRASEVFDMPFSVANKLVQQAMNSVYPNIGSLKPVTSAVEQRVYKKNQFLDPGWEGRQNAWERDGMEVLEWATPKGEKNTYGHAFSWALGKFLSSGNAYGDGYNIAPDAIMAIGRDFGLSKYSSKRNISDLYSGEIDQKKSIIMGAALGKSENFKKAVTERRKDLDTDRQWSNIEKASRDTKTENVNRGGEGDSTSDIINSGLNVKRYVQDKDIVGGLTEFDWNKTPGLTAIANGAPEIGPEAVRMGVEDAHRVFQLIVNNHNIASKSSKSRTNPWLRDTMYATPQKSFSGRWANLSGKQKGIVDKTKEEYLDDITNEYSLVNKLEETKSFSRDPEREAWRDRVYDEQVKDLQEKLSENDKRILERFKNAVKIIGEMKNDGSGGPGFFNSIGNWMKEKTQNLGSAVRNLIPGKTVTYSRDGLGNVISSNDKPKNQLLIGPPRPIGPMKPADLKTITPKSVEEQKEIALKKFMENPESKRQKKIVIPEGIRANFAATEQKPSTRWTNVSSNVTQPSQSSVTQNSSSMSQSAFPQYVPKEYTPYLADAAQRHGVDPHKVAAMIMQESSWNPQSVNRLSSAKGLGQILDGTYNEIQSRYKKFDRMNPVEAIDAIAWYMNDIGKRIGTNDFFEQVKAYYMGIGGYLDRFNPARAARLAEAEQHVEKIKNYLLTDSL